MISAADIIRRTNPFESTIQQILELDALRRDRFVVDVERIEGQKKALSDIGSAFSSLQTVLNSFSNNSEASFKPLRASSSSDAVNILSVGNSAQNGNFDLQVEQVAKRDTVASIAIDRDGDELSATGEGSFDITIGGVTETVTVDTTDLTNEEVLNKIRQAVNDLDLGVTASVLQVADNELALSIKSDETGSAHKISLDDNEGGDFTALAMYGLYEEEGELDAKFEIDGVAMTRSSNVIENAIEGLSFEITRITENEIISITQDTESSRGEVESFIEAFNKLNSELRSKTHIDAESGTRGLLQGERSLRNLSMSMRQILAQPVEGADGNMIFLSDLGIEIGSNGTLSIGDTSQLESILVQQPDLIEQYFTAPEGIVENLKNNIGSMLTGQSSLLSSIEENFNSRIDRINTRIQREEQYLERRENQLRTEFNRLQQIIDDGEAQFQSIINFQSRLGF